MQRKQGKAKKRKKAIKVQDLRPSKDTKGGLAALPDRKL
jgi:hypothetical protein